MKRWGALVLVVVGLLAGGGGAPVAAVETVTPVTLLISQSSAGVQADEASWAPSISADGTVVAFASVARNLGADGYREGRDNFVRDWRTGTTQLASPARFDGDSGGSTNEPRVSADGRYVSYDSASNRLVADDTNDWFEPFLYDRRTDTVERVGVDSRERPLASAWNATVAAGGRLVFFMSEEYGLTVRDRVN